MTFEPRLTAPDESDPHYNSSDNIFAQCGFGMFENGGNCTAYAWGRLYEITGKKFYALHGNAEKWWDAADNAGLSKGQTPKLGAIACWMQGDTSTAADGAGHVAVVEEIHDDGSWTASMSGYQHYLFKTVEIGADNAYGGMDFRGFIYCGLEFDGKEAMSMDDAKKLVVCDFPQYLGHAVPEDMIESEARHIVEDGLSTEDYDAEVMATPDYQQNHPHLETCDFIDRCYRAYLGRPASDGEQNFQAGAIERGEARYRDIAWNIYTSDEAKAYRGEA